MKQKFLTPEKNVLILTGKNGFIVGKELHRTHHDTTIHFQHRECVCLEHSFSSFSFYTQTTPV